MNNNSNNVSEIENDTLGDIEDVANSVDKLINELPPISPNCCIYRVSPQVRNLNERLYVPRVVAIGPFHHGDPELKPMEEHKLRYLQAFLSRHDLSLKDCENVITKREKEIRNSYAENLHLTHPQLVKIFLIDSCFVVEAILSYFEPSFERKVYLPRSNFLFDTDMMLLENQLPFFVLDDLYHLAFPQHPPETQFLEFCIRYFFYRMLIQGDDSDEGKLITKVKDYLVASGHKIQHFVDLLRVCHLPSATRPPRLPSGETIEVVTIPKVTEAHEAGIKSKKVIDYLVALSHKIQHFVDLLRVCHLLSATRPPRLSADTETIDVVTIPKVTEAHEAGIEIKKASSIFALDIQYKPAMLEIPRVVVDEAAEYLLSNILVLEMCHYQRDSYVRDYVYFMDMLIDTAKDVDLLIQKGIIATWTGDSSAVADLFNKVGYNFPLVGSKYYFCGVSRDLNAYCSVPRHRWKAAFKRDYCSTPWMIVSTTAAIILLVLTFIQAICSIIQTIPSIKSF